MDDRETPNPLKDLGSRIDKAYGGRGGAGRKSGGSSGGNEGLTMGLRIGVELVVAVAVGAGLGWLIDHWLGSGPWGMIGGFFLGVGVGMVNVYRTIAGLGMAVGYRNSGPGAPRGSDGDWDED